MALLHGIKRHERSMVSGLATLVLALLSANALAAKDVNESCEADADCDSGHCVTVKDGGKKCSDCDQDKLGSLTSGVDEKCKDFDSGIFGYSALEREFGSRNEVSLVQLNYRAKYVKECLDARSNRENTCWDGGDSGHKTQIDELKKTISYLQGLIDDKSRNNLGYNCEPDKYDDLQEDIDDNCEDVDEDFARYGMDDGKETSCSDLDDLIDESIDCREALEDMADNCFRNGAPAARVKRLADVRDIERIANEKKAKGCK
jgi:Novel toxin 16